MAQGGPIASLLRSTQERSAGYKADPQPLDCGCHSHFFRVLSAPLVDGSQSSFNSECGGLQGFSRKCPNTGHLQCCRLVHAPDLCQVLWPRYAGHSRLFRSLALVLLLRDTHMAGTRKSGSVGILFPRASYRTQLEFLKRNASGYVCNSGSSKEWGAASWCPTSCIPASVLLHSLKLIPAASHVLLYQLVITSPRPGRLSHNLDWLHTIFRAAYTGDLPQRVLPDAASRSFEKPGLHT